MWYFSLLVFLIFTSFLKRVRFLMARDRDKETSEVRQLILNTLEQEQRVESSPDPESEEDVPNGTFDAGSYDSTDSPDNTRLMQVSSVDFIFSNFLKTYLVEFLVFDEFFVSTNLTGHHIEVCLGCTKPIIARAVVT